MGSLPHRPAGRFRSIPGGSRRLTVDQSGSPYGLSPIRHHRRCLAAASPPRRRLVSPHHVSSRRASSHLASRRLALSRFITPRLVSSRSLRPVSPRLAPSRPVSPRLISPHLASPRHVLPCLASPRPVSSRLSRLAIIAAASPSPRRLAAASSCHISHYVSSRLASSYEPSRHISFQLAAPGLALPRLVLPCLASPRPASPRQSVSPRRRTVLAAPPRRRRLSSHRLRSAAYATYHRRLSHGLPREPCASQPFGISSRILSYLIFSFLYIFFSLYFLFFSGLFFVLLFLSFFRHAARAAASHVLSLWCEHFSRFPPWPKLPATRLLRFFERSMGSGQSASALKKAKKKPADAEATRIWNDMDADNGGTLSVKEIIDALKKNYPDYKASKIKAAVDHFDKDADGKISREEVWRLSLMPMRPIRCCCSVLCC